MKLPNALQMKELDEFTIQKRNIQSIELMEEAASKAASFIFSRYNDNDRPVTVFAGPGNNGGDGLAVARLMHGHGFTNIQVYLFNTNNSISEDCSANAERLKNECPEIQFTEVTQTFEAPSLSSKTLVIDALFGTGINKPLSGGYAALVKLINSTRAEVISLDMPSGLMCEDNTFNSPSSIIRAKYTLTFGLPKLALILADNQRYAGEVHVLDINLAYEGLNDMDINFFISEPEEIRRLLKGRPKYGHKGTFGNGLLIAGKYGMAGAAVLAAKACLTSGAGKVTIHTPKKNNDILQIAVPEAVLQHDADDNIFTESVRTDHFQSVAIGPGLGTEKKTALALIEQISHTNVPLIIDADAINILGDHKGWIQQVPKNTIFTPHQEEMKRLGICNSDSYSVLLEAINMAQRYHFFIILKGHYTAICTPGGCVHFNPTGNSGMATAGSGDVLTGIILALTAQKYTTENACLLGTYLHGLAGDLAAQEKGEYSVTASDIITKLPEAFKTLNAETPIENQWNTSGDVTL